MTQINRQQLKLLTETLGRAWSAIDISVGDIDKNPAALLRLERALCRLKGSVRFHDFDYALQNDSLLKFNSLDRIGYGLQGGKFIGNNNKVQLQFPSYTSGVWNPGYDGPPSPEGWGVWDYNQWKGYPRVRPSNNDENPEPDYSLRLNELTPVRYHVGSGNYQQVSFWQNAKWISIKNTTGNVSPNNRFKITLTQSELEGILMTDASTDIPLDLQFYSHATLHQAATTDGNGNLSWSAPSSMPAVSDDINGILYPVAYEIVRNTTVTSSWDITISVPNYLTSWNNNEWWHIVMYWGSKDAFTLGLTPPSPTAHPVVVVTANNQIRWEKKSFFRNELTDFVKWSSLAINDKLDASNSNIHFINTRRTHFHFIDGQYSNPTAPSAYHLLQSWPESQLHGLPNSITGYISDIDKGCFIPVLYLVKNRGTEYDYPQSDPFIFVGKQIAFEAQVDNWDTYQYWPDIPQDYSLIARAIYRRAPGVIYQTVEGVDGDLIDQVKVFEFESTVDPSNLHHCCSLVYLDQPAVTFAHPPYNDPVLTLGLLPSLSNIVSSYRSLRAVNPILNAAFSLIVPAARTPNNLIKSRLILANPNSTSSQVFRGLLKKPNNPLLKMGLQDSVEALQFTVNGRGLIEDLTGLPPSTELMRFDADKLYLLNNKFNIPTQLELFQQVSDSCSVVDFASAGVSVGLDYKLRLILEDINENIFQKDWDIMASKYYLTNQEYNNRVAQGLTTIGYFKPGTTEEQNTRARGTLQTIDEWRLHGYAGIVPDLTMGDYRTLYTKVVAPEDEDKITETQFRQNLINQGYSAEQIDEKVQEYLDNGGEFYVVDLRQYSNEFVGVRSASLSISEYSFDTVPYWKNNIKPYFGLPQVNGENPMPSLTSLRADSFTIASSNLLPGDLENFGTQAQLPNDTALDSTTHSGIEKIFNTEKIGFYLETTDTSGIGEFAFKMKAIFDIDNTTSEFTNTNSVTLQVSLYSSTVDDNNMDIPGELIVNGGLIDMKSITDVYQEFRFNLYSTLSSNTKYWIIVEKNAEPEGGIIVFDSDSGVNPTDGGVAYLWDSTFWDTPNADTWQQSSGGAWLKCYDDMGGLLIDHSSNTYSGIEEPFIAKSQAIYLPSDNLLSSVRSFSIKMKFVPDETNQMQVPYNHADDKITARIFSDVGGGIPVIDEAINGTFIRIMNITTEYQEYTFGIDELDLGNNYWIVLTQNAKPKGGIIVVDKGDSPNNIYKLNNNQWNIDSGIAWFKFYQSSRFILGAFNRDTSNILQYLPGPNIAREFNDIYKVDGFWAFTCDALPTSGPISIYPRAVNDGSNWSYVRFSHDICVCVRYELGGKIYDYITKLPGAEGWRNLWWKRNSSSYKFVDVSVNPDVDTVTDIINYTNYDFDNTQDTYFNGRFEGTVQALEDGAHRIRVSFNDGIRLYFNGELLIDSWPTSDPNTSQILTAMTPMLSTSSDVYYSVVVEYYFGAPYDVSDNQILHLEWSPPSNLSAYENMGTTSVAPNEIQISSENVDRLVYLSVGRTLDKFNTISHGAPPGDVLILRSK